MLKFWPNLDASIILIIYIKQVVTFIGLIVFCGTLSRGSSEQLVCRLLPIGTTREDPYTEDQTYTTNTCMLIYFCCIKLRYDKKLCSIGDSYYINKFL